MSISIIPVLPVREGKERPLVEEKRPVDSKVKGLVLGVISQAQGGLLPTAIAPQIVFHLLPAFGAVKMPQAPREKRKLKLRRTPLIRRVPIGLSPVDSEGWVNALMQFFLFVPGLAELFYFAPRSLSPFQEFVDQYFHDQQEGNLLSAANGAALFRFFVLKLPGSSYLDRVRFLIRALDPQWEIHRNLDEALREGARPERFFVTESLMKKQLFTMPDSFYYDLDAFIELRPDGAAAHYIAYVKVEGSWYQCDDDRITLLRSHHLHIPLQRSVLLHYRRESPCRKVF